MAVVQLATSVDVANALGRVLTLDESARVEPVLDQASELFRRAAGGQLFTPGTSTVRLKVNGGRVYLPQHPVTAVTSVTDDDEVAVDYERVGQWLDVSLGSDAFVRVVYAHGGDVPDLVRLCIADIGRRVLAIPASAAAGATQHAETKGPFSTSDTYAAWAVGGQVMLAPADTALAASYRPRAPRIIVMKP